MQLHPASVQVQVLVREHMGEGRFAHQLLLCLWREDLAQGVFADE